MKSSRSNTRVVAFDDNDYGDDIDDLVYDNDPLKADKTGPCVGDFFPKTNINPEELVDWGAALEPCLKKQQDIVYEITTKDGKNDKFFVDNMRLAAMNGNLEIIESLIKDNSVPVDLILKNDWTALMYACNHCHPEVVSFLLEAGADGNFTKKLFTPVLAAVVASPEDTRDEAVIQDRIIQCLCLLVKNNAEINVQDQFGDSALHFAVKKNRLLVIEELISLNIDVNHSDCYGYTALHYAAQFGFGRVARLLVDHGSDLNLITHSGERPEDVAFIHEHEELGKLLSRFRKDPDNKDQVILGDPEEKSAFGTGKEETDDQSRQLHNDLQVFLSGLGLSSLESVFIKNDMATLPQVLTVTEEDLVKMGIDSLGQRKTLLDAIQGFNLFPGFNRESLPPVTESESTKNNRKREKNEITNDISAASLHNYLFNVSRHLKYMKVNLRFIEKKISTDPQAFEDSKNDVLFKEITREFNECVKNSIGVTKVLKEISQDLKEVESKYDLKPTDLILPQDVDLFEEEEVVFPKNIDNIKQREHRSPEIRDLTISLIVTVGVISAVFYCINRSST